MSHKYHNLHNDFSFKNSCPKSTVMTIHFPIQVDVEYKIVLEGFQSTFSS